MMTLDDVRAQYPQYADMPDNALASALHSKYYSDMPFGEFATKIGLVKPPKPEDPGALMAGVIGAGRVTDQAIQGVKDLALSVPAAFGSQSAQKERARMKQEQDANSKIYENLSQQHPVATFLGEAAPMVAALPAATTVGGAAAIGSLPGLIAYGSPEERLTRGALGAAGGAVGALAGKAVGRILQPVQTPISQSRQAAIDAADRLGVDLRASEKTGSRPLGWMEGALNDLPISGGMAQTKEAARRAAINTAGARSIGQAADELTPNVLAAGRADTSGMFNQVLNGLDITLDNTFRQNVKGIVGSKVLKGLRDQSVEDVIAPFQNMPQGTIKVTGDWFQQNKTALDNVIRSAYNAGDAPKARALEAFERALDDAAKRSMTPAQKTVFNTAQKQWAALRMLETGSVVDAGNVMPGRLNQAMASRYKAAFKEGKIQGDLADIAKLGEVFKPLPQSGTTPRAVYSGLASGAFWMNPLATAGMFATPPLLQKGLQSSAGQRYLTQGLMNVTPELDKLLTQGGAGLLGIPLVTAAQ